MPIVNPEDLLIAPPDFEGLPRAPKTEDPLRDGFHAVFDYFNLNAIAWPVFGPGGHLNIPPDDHIRDYLARAHDLVPDDVAAVRPAANTVAVVPMLPSCDQCDRPARFDAVVRTGDEHFGANLCAACYAGIGSGTLGGESGDAYLLEYNEVPDAVRTDCDEVAAALGRPSLWSSD